MTRFFYTLGILFLLPWAVVHLLWRSRRQPDYRKHWNERFGLFEGQQPAAVWPEATSSPTPTLWIHAVSVGETRAAQPVIAALRKRFPSHRIVLTHMTPTGRETSEALFSNSIERVYLPYDTPWAVRRFLNWLRPEFGLIMETELWPNLIAECKTRGIPLHLVNARLSERSARRYAALPALTAHALAGLSGVCAQTQADAERLEQLGARRIIVTGNVKFDIDVPEQQLVLGQELRQRGGERRVWLAASTREGEEELILDAWGKVSKGGDAGVSQSTLLVIVPRHPQRFDEVAKLAVSRGFRLQRRSDNTSIAAGTQILLGDSMGEMFAYYAMADVAFVGGSLLDFGSQNLIEPCAVGTPVLVGPSTRNFTEAAHGAVACGAAIQIADATHLVNEVQRLLNDESARQGMGEAGRQFATRHRGATQRTLDALSLRNH